MDNHQLELAQHLSSQKYCLMATPSYVSMERSDRRTLVGSIRASEDGTFKSIPRSDGQVLARIVHEEMAHVRH